MKRLFNIFLAVAIIGISGCKKEDDTTKIVFVTSSGYPPFEYIHEGKLTGFDIDLATAIAEEIGREAIFEDREFSAVFPTLQSGQADAAIGTLTITPERQKNFDFTPPYYHETMAVVYEKAHPIKTAGALSGQKIVCQLGSTMEIWLRKNVPSADIMTLDKTNQAIEALKAGHVNAVVVDGVQAALFVQQNPELGFDILGTSEDGYGVAFPKESPLYAPVNAALEKLKSNGTLAKIQAKWLSETPA